MRARWLRNWADSLQGKTLLRVAPIAVAAIAVIWFMVATAAREQQRGVLQDSLEKRLVAEAEIHVLALDNIISSARNAARNSITVGALIGQDVERVVRPFLGTFAVGSTERHRAAIFDFLGEPIVSTGLETGRIGHSARRDWLDAALNGEESFDLAEDRLALVLPIFLGATPEGALLFEIPTSEIFPRLAPSEGRRTAGGAVVRIVEIHGPSGAPRTDRLPWGVSGEMTLRSEEMPGIGVEIRQSAQLPNVLDDPIQKFLAALFLSLFALILAGIYVSTMLVSGPIRALIGQIERHGIDIGPAQASAPDEIRKLAERFAAAAAEVREALRQEKELTAQQRQFVAMVSHEFRTPLAIIDGAAGALMRRRARMTEDAVTDTLSRIRRGVQRLIRLMESTLTASKLEAGTIALRRADFDLRGLLRQLAEERHAISGHARITLDIDALPESVKVDDRLMYSVFDNLVSNAIKYGGDEPSVQVRGWLDGGDVLVSISDNGLGIPRDELPKIGQRFFRATTSAGVAGTGIGLNMVKLVTQMHGGEMSVDSELGVGSTFTVRLTVDEAPGEDADELPAAPADEAVAAVA